MTRRHQKNEELIYAKSTAQSLGEAWDVTFPQNEIDWPDLIVEENGRIFGLEVSELFGDMKKRGSPSKAAEVKRRKNLSLAANEYYKTNSIPINVNLYGDPGNPVEFAQMVMRQKIDKLSMWQNKRFGAGKQQWMYIRRLPSNLAKYKRWKILSDMAGFTGKMDPTIVQKAINKKARRLDCYKRNINDVRLLLVCNQIYNSGKYWFTNTETIQPNGFNHIYLFQYPDSVKHIPQISTTP